MGNVGGADEGAFTSISIKMRWMHTILYKIVKYWHFLDEHSSRQGMSIYNPSTCQHLSIIHGYQSWNTQHLCGRTLAAIIVDITYGIRITDMNDRYVHLARQSVEAINESRKPGAFWLDYFPILKHVPAWVPGAAGKKLGRMYKPIVEEVRDRAFDAVKNDVVSLSLVISNAP